MRLNITLLFTILFQVFLIKCNQSLFKDIEETYIKCGDEYCISGKGECYQDNLKTLCLCYEEYGTFPKDSLIRCNYLKRSKIKAFLLELFLSFGSGHFYCKNFKMAIPKFFFWFLSYYGFIILKALRKADETNNRLNNYIRLSAVLVLIIMLAWQIVDIILFGMNYNLDGNGIELI